MEMQREQLGTYYEQCRHQLLAFCIKRLGNRDEAEDAVQDVFKKALNGCNTLLSDTHEISVKAWLFQIANNHTVDVLRRRRLMTRIVEYNIEVDGELAVADKADELALALLINDIQDLINQLPSEQQKLVMRLVLHDYSAAQIAEQTGIKYDNIKAIICRARAGLTRLDNQGCSITSLVIKRRIKK